MDYNDIKNHNKLNRLNKKTLIIVGIAILIAIVIVLIIAISSTHKTPSKVQMQNDLIQQELESKNLAISDFSIYSENKNDNKYTAITGITYTKDGVEYSEKYLLTYSKYDEWELYDIEDCDKKLWTKKPLVQPNIDKYTKLCKEELKSDHHFYNYDSFAYNQKQSKLDVENGEVIYAFDVNKKTIIENRAGIVLFDIKFDYDTGNWYFDDITYDNSYKISYDFKKTWIGTLECDSESSFNDNPSKNVNLSITNFEKSEVDGTIKGKFIFGDKTYEMDGTITLPESNTSLYSDDEYKIEMIGTNDENKCKFDGTLKTDGSMEVRFNRDYTGGDSGLYLYYNYDIFEGSISIKQ